MGIFRVLFLGNLRDLDILQLETAIFRCGGLGTKECHEFDF